MCLIAMISAVLCGGTRCERAGCAGVVFVGGFSYADVMDSAKGWAGTIRCNKRLSDAFKAFYNRCCCPALYVSFGVCQNLVASHLSWLCINMWTLAHLYFFMPFRYQKYPDHAAIPREASLQHRMLSFVHRPKRVGSGFDSFVLGACRSDTFSLGVCNGCQLMALLGWVPGTEAQLADPAQPRFIHNTSGRFESRWATVQIQQDSPAIMLKVRHLNVCIIMKLCICSLCSACCLAVLSFANSLKAVSVCIEDLAVIQVSESVL